MTEWADTLNHIFSLLREKGVLIFGERMVLSQGERPYGKSGYLVLRQKELSTLFCDGNVEELFLGKDKRDPTVCCVIQLNGRMVTSTHVTETIKVLRDRSWDMIQRFIEQGTDARQAREYAFYCQQYINAKHALGLLAGQLSVKDMTLNQILNQHTGEKRCQLLRERGLIPDEEGERCREWLEHNQR